MILGVAAVTGVAWLAYSTCLPAQEDPRIRLNSLGFLPGGEKRATIAAPCGEFAVVREKDGGKALEGKASGPVTDADTGEQVSIADFSALREPGEYRLDDPGVGRSARFCIAADLYVDPFATVMRGMYLRRCGAAVSAVHGGDTFAHQACHTEDAWLDVVSEEHARADGAKGWHDAGDYNKYVVLE